MTIAPKTTACDVAVSDAAELISSSLKRDDDDHAAGRSRVLRAEPGWPGRHRAQVDGAREREHWREYR